MKMVSPQINLVVVFYFKFHLGIEVAVKLLIGKTSLTICLHFSPNRFSLRKVQWNWEKEIMKITGRSFPLSFVFLFKSLTCVNKVITVLEMDIESSH